MIAIYKLGLYGLSSKIWALPIIHMNIAFVNVYAHGKLIKMTRIMRGSQKV